MLSRAQRGQARAAPWTDPVEHQRRHGHINRYWEGNSTTSSPAGNQTFRCTAAGQPQAPPTNQHEQGVAMPTVTPGEPGGDLLRVRLMIRRAELIWFLQQLQEENCRSAFIKVTLPPTEVFTSILRSVLSMTPPHKCPETQRMLKSQTRARELSLFLKVKVEITEDGHSYTLLPRHLFSKTF